VRRALLTAVFLLVVLGVVAGLHLYLAAGLVEAAGLGDTGRRLALAGLALLGASLVAAPIAERTLPRPLARLLAWPAALWMGFAFLLATLLAVTDLGLWLGGSTAQAALAGVAGPQAEPGPARAAAVLGLAALLGALGLRSGLRPPAVRRVELRLARWPRALDGFRIVQISDLHLGTILGRRFAAELAARVNALRPDLVAVTGDLVDGSVARVADEVAPLAELRAPHGVYFVTGNHDHYSGADAWAAQARALGWRVLRNEHVGIGEDEAGFDLAGVEDHHASLVSGTSREDLPAALAGRDPARPVILLAHDPTTFQQAARRGVDLQLSGHTHGGQIWPFTLLVRLAIPFVAGLYRRGGSLLYVSRGTGFWGPPMRLLAPAEITELVLRPQVGAA
jgi:hypothetical protein